MKLMHSLLAAAGAAVLAQGALAADKLPAFNVDLAETSVSGLSSGAFMAVQLQVAHSASIKGAGVVAGGPYYCAADNMMFTAICMGQVPFVTPNAALMVTAAKNFASQRKIDSLSNLAGRRVYVFSGFDDTVVKQPAVDATVSFFTQAGVSGANLKYVNTVPAGHAVITPGFGNACSANASPYISHCTVDGSGYDQAGELLKHIYGNLKDKAATPSGRMVTFDQRSFAPASTAMAEQAYLYVPKSCEQGQSCKVHVAIHGCVQSAESVGDAFINNTGYNAWADTNNMLVLYPQVNKSIVPTNPQGCWDWWGYTGVDYAVKSGAQITAIMKMVKALKAPAAAAAKDL
ncbi:extracellular catalytic domain type 2 short-chain-length polyhydroxyalkanoate depolymerase [Azohydromonas aeria]|uniref:extracellular catalytic domain type 2 short-chain-length polyhydroxyalkanoate depolymerase n=1 Tax=Azohydromonas aeria TaxID=2590212 RepID=UPI0012FB79CA|nr:PHB depolymerase family esterase [Azohydromonas aeria]